MRVKDPIAIAACLGLLWAVGPLMGSTLRTVALSGDSIPGTTTGQTFTYLALPLLNDLGQTGFLSGLQISINDPFTFHVGTRAWSEATGTLAPVAAAGDTPGVPGDPTFGFFNQIGFNNAGKTALRANLQGGGLGVNIFATYVQTSSGLALIFKIRGSHSGHSRSSVQLARKPLFQ